ncbi:MAG: hypothetical protein ACLGGX_06085 [Bdellovibrionia bacterium]
MNALKVILIWGGLIGGASAFAGEATTLKMTNQLTQKGIPYEPQTMRITNRAQCAIDSEFPTTSAFIVLDGYNAGKLAHNIAQNLVRDGKSVNATEYAEKAMSDFRLAVAGLTSTISDKLRTGKLPLLPAEYNKSQLQTYPKLAAQCGTKPYCPELSQYLQKVWDASELPGVNRQAQVWSRIDNFQEKDFSWSMMSASSCYYLKKFSPLQAHLHHSKATAPQLEELARAYTNRGEYIASCMDRSSALDNRNVALQLDFIVAEPDAWNKKGFDYWNSLRIYLSWAWRNTNITRQYSTHFAEVFKSLALEESMMFLSNSCKSITKPACDSEGLSINSIRELAKSNGKATEHSAQTPQSPESNLISRGARGVNDDFLGTRSYDTASDWVENFRKNYVNHRGSMKNRFQSSLQMMKLINQTLDPDQLNITFQNLLVTHVNSNMRNEAYYFCTELRLAGDKRIDFLRSDIDRIPQLKSLLSVADVSNADLEKALNYFSRYVDKMMPLCESLETQKYWQELDYTVDKSGFNVWAKELLQIPVVDASGQFINPSAKVFGQPFLVWRQDMPATGDNVICASSIDCGRKVIKAMVDLHAVSVYADAFLPVSSEAVAANVFNPYTELKACKIYDPWYQTKRTHKKFLVDLANTAVFGFTALPIFIDVNFSYPKVTSFKSLVQQGKITYAPNVDKAKMEAALVADFGPLIGAPCAVSIAPTSNAALKYYAFNGISVNYCDSKTKNSGQVEKPDEIYNTGKTRSYCGGCSLNFISVASAGSGIIESTPLKGFVYLFRAIYNFTTGMKDDVNIPKTYNLNLKYVADTYKANNGRIPEHCVEQLGAGLKCFKDMCSARVAEHVERITGTQVQDVFLQSDRDTDVQFTSGSARAWVKTNACDGELLLNISCTHNGEKFFATKPNSWSGTKSCRGKF